MWHNLILIKLYKKTLENINKLNRDGKLYYYINTKKNFILNSLIIKMYYKNICIICENIFYHAEKHIDICFECIKLIHEYMKKKNEEN